MVRAILLLLVVAAVGRHARASEPLPTLGDTTGFAASAPSANDGVDPAAWQTGAVHNPWYGGVEFGVTRFAYSNSSFALTDDDVGASFRPYFGYQAASGVGIRASVFAATTSSVATRSSDASEFDIDQSAVSFAVDLYRELWFDDFRLLLGAGSEAAAYGFQYENGNEDTWSAGGTSVFAEGAQPFYVTPCSEWSVIGGGRVGYLLGEVSYSSPPGYDSIGTSIVLGRAFLGLEYRRHCSWGDFVFQYRGESQVWDSSEIGQIGLSTSALEFGAAW